MNVCGSSSDNYENKRELIYQPLNDYCINERFYEKKEEEYPQIVLSPADIKSIEKHEKRYLPRDVVMREIKKAMAEGNLSCELIGNIHPDVKTELENGGYKISRSKISRNTEHIKISWD